MTPLLTLLPEHGWWVQYEVTAALTDSGQESPFSAHSQKAANTGSGQRRQGETHHLPDVQKRFSQNLFSGKRKKASAEQ
jgi:hypothetical protein